MRRVYRAPSTQPQQGYPVAVDWSHPLAAGLIGCYVGSYPGIRSSPTLPINLHDLSGAGTELLCVDNSSALGLGPIGYGPTGLSSTSQSGWQATASAAQRPSFGVSLFVRCYKASAGVTMSSYPMVFGCGWTNSNTSPYDTWDITNGPTDDQLNFTFNVGGTATGAGGAGLVAIGGSYNLGMTAQADGVAGHIRPFVNGVLQTTGTPGSGSIGYGPTPTLCLTGKIGVGAASHMQTLCAYIWNHMLTDDFMAWLNVEPYAMLRPVIRRRWMPGAAVAAGAQARALILA